MPGLLKDNLFNYIPIVVTGWRDGALFLYVANHETAHLAVIAIFAHGVKDNLGLSAIGVAHSLNIAAAAIHAVVVDGHGERVGVLYILALILQLGDALADGLGQIDGVIHALHHIVIVVRGLAIEAGCVFHVFAQFSPVDFDAVEIVLIDVEAGQILQGNLALVDVLAGVKGGCCG